MFQTLSQLKSSPATTPKVTTTTANNFKTLTQIKQESTPKVTAPTSKPSDLISTIPQSNLGVGGNTSASNFQTISQLKTPTTQTIQSNTPSTGLSPTESGQSAKMVNPQTSPLVNGIVKAAGIVNDVGKGIAGEYSNPSADPLNITPYQPSTIGEKIGSALMQLGQYTVMGENVFKAPGFNETLNAVLQTSKPVAVVSQKFSNASEAVQKGLKDIYKSFDSKISPIIDALKNESFTMKDVADVTSGHGTPKQIARFQELQTKYGDNFVNVIKSASKFDESKQTVFDYLSAVKDRLSSIVPKAEEEQTTKSITTGEMPQLKESDINYVDPKVYAENLPNAKSGGLKPISEITIPDRLQGEVDPNQIAANKITIPAGDKINPVVINQNGVLLDGFHKLTALKEMGIKNVQTVVQTTPEVKPQIITEKQPITNKIVNPTVSSEVTEPIGELKQSKIGKEVDAKAIEANLTKGFENTAGYETINIKEQAKMGADLVNKDINGVRKILRGEAPLPDKLKGTALIKSVEDYLKINPDADIAYELANSSLITGTSQAAQELRLAAERDPYSLTSIVDDVNKARATKFYKEKGIKPEEARTKEVESIKKEMKKVAPTKDEWMDFVRSIDCGGAR